MAEIAYREATLDDAAEIHALLLRLAPEIPILVDTLQREEALYALTRSCVRSGESWVGLDREKRIVGFVLVEPNQLARHYAEHEVLELHFAGVAAERRRCGIFGYLVGKILARMVPVTARVHPQNRCGAALRLECFGFRDTGAPSGGERRLRWEPGART